MASKRLSIPTVKLRSTRCVRWFCSNLVTAKAVKVGTRADPFLKV